MGAASLLLQTMLTSLVVPLSPEPVLPPTIQSLGMPTRRRLSPVRLASIHSRSWVWLAASSGPCLSVSRPSTVRDIERGVVVSRGSPAMAVLRSVSVRSRRVFMSPSVRSQRVSPAGPPCRLSNRLAAVLSLTTTAASLSARTVMPSASACFSVTGEYATSSFFS